jgi:quercetin dioxygenase-like cupin family protein
MLKAGEAVFETTGVTHWLRNQTSQPVRALVVDIVEESTP